ncbi:hypothetical protein BCR35DRAFT_355022 [Leucosporidium creatinivorum]|uniref:Alpha/Beta hydrolase protein n=1 Tax=Leucosporidium creatinivorum TaxID=106004 RepID=A0A1Y2DWY8_9BASI|nr:hypothetical protein BCR35DRAFT_355022 [Leucosporidium creatinivorum]
MSPLLPKSVAGTLHTYSVEPDLTAFEHSTSSPSTSIVLLIPGLNGSLPAVGYATPLAQALDKEGWGLAEVLLSSAGAGWGGGSVKDDAEELAVAVRYFKERQGKDKVVLMGHSTGCQDVIAYSHLLLRSSVRSITATILQAPVSDREPWEAHAKESGLDKEYPSPLIPSPPATLDYFIPPVLSKLCGAKAGITYRRWNSLTAKTESDEVDIEASEDFFSSDNSEARWASAFAPVETKVLVLLSEKDESYGSHVDPRKLLPMFRKALGEERWAEQSRIIEGADHAIEQAPQRKVMIEAVTSFVRTL